MVKSNFFIQSTNSPTILLSTGELSFCNKSVSEFILFVSCLTPFSFGFSCFIGVAVVFLVIVLVLPVELSVFDGFLVIVVFVTVVVVVLGVLVRFVVVEDVV